MKKDLLPLLFAGCALPALAQQTTVSFGWEAAFHGFGVSMDRRIAPRSLWGYRVGIGYAYDHPKDSFTKYKGDGIVFPLELHFLTRGKHHKFESAIGTSFGYIWRTFDSQHARIYYHSFIPDRRTQADRIHQEYGRDPGIKKQTYVTEVNNTFDYSFYLSAGYRFQSSFGLTLRAGVSTPTGFNSIYNLGDQSTQLYFSAGYTF